MVVGVNKNLLSSLFLFLHVTANQRCIVPSFTAFSIREMLEKCDSSDSKKTILLGYIRARGRRARGVDQDTETLSMVGKGHWHFRPRTYLCNLKLSFWVE